MREDAGLPTLIRASGLSRADWLRQHWRSEGHLTQGWGAQGLQVSAPDGSKLKLLRQLLAQDDPTDVEIKPPSLEDLYRHYMVRAATEEAGS